MAAPGSFRHNAGIMNSVHSLPLASVALSPPGVQTPALFFAARVPVMLFVLHIDGMRVK